MDQASCTSQGDAFQFLLGECVGRRLAAEKPSVSQPWGKLAWAVFVLSVPLTLPQTSSHSAFHGFSESALCTKVWVCFQPGRKKKSHIGSVCTHSFPHCNLCWLGEEIQRNWTPLCRVELLRRAPTPSKNVHKSPFALVNRQRDISLEKGFSSGGPKGCSVHLCTSS